MQTWQVWEQLVSLSLRNALLPKNVLLQSPNRLGTRTQDGAVRVLNVVPDAIVTISNTTGSRRVIVDAQGNVVDVVSETQAALGNAADTFEANAAVAPESIEDFARHAGHGDILREQIEHSRVVEE